MTTNTHELSRSAADKIITSTHVTVDSVNEFTDKVFHTRGGRIGSGMGSVIEGLWGFYLNSVLKKEKDITYCQRCSETVFFLAV